MRGASERKRESERGPQTDTHHHQHHHHHTHRRHDAPTPIPIVDLPRSRKPSFSPTRFSIIIIIIATTTERRGPIATLSPRHHRRSIRSDLAVSPFRRAFVPAAGAFPICHDSIPHDSPQSRGQTRGRSIARVNQKILPPGPR